MSNSTVALALAIASVPVYFMASRSSTPTPPRVSVTQQGGLGDCKSEIRPQIVAIEPISSSTTTAVATLMVTSLTDSSRPIITRGSGLDASEELIAYQRYTLTVTYPGGTPTAVLTDSAGTTVVSGFDSIPSPIDTPADESWLNVVDARTFPNADLIQVNRNGWLTTVYLTRP